MLEMIQTFSLLSTSEKKNLMTFVKKMCYIIIIVVIVIIMRIIV